MSDKKKVVVIGGGTGLSVMLRGLKKKDLDIVAIVTVSDDGGSSGKLRSEFDILPPGDIRNVLISLANTEPLLEELLQYRFTKGKGLKDHNLGNLLITAMHDITGDFILAINALSKVLAVNGQVYPATLEKVNLYAEYKDGVIVKGESNIPNVGKEINRVFIEPSSAKAVCDAILAIGAADAIIMGPGSLYTSIIPNLLVPDLREAIVKSKGKKILICNIMTQPGETDNHTVLDHINAIEEHVGCKFLEYIIVNDEEISQDVIDQYTLKGATPVIMDKELLLYEYKLVSEKMLKYSDYLRHDEDKLTEVILKIIN